MKLKTGADVTKAMNKLRGVAQVLKEKQETDLPEIARVTWEVARTLAPFYEGELHDKISLEQLAENSWRIKSSGKHRSNLTPSINIRFDEGDFSGMTMFADGGVKVPFQPRLSTSIGFMKQAEQFAQEEISKLNLEIVRTVRNVK